MSTTPTKNYKDTLNLPKTEFAMKAGLVQREPERLAKWKQMDLYSTVQKAHAEDPVFTLHDGPPFANGDIHMGHLLNKVLKDVVMRYQTMAGYRTPYVPGWDCHGLPIEHQVQQKLGSKLREMETLQVRKLCWDHASKFIERQSEQFQRLGILGDWAHPYRTMAPEYEAQTIDVFAQFVEHGLAYKKLKPVHWSIANRTALADAELEYQRRTDPSVFVECPVENPGNTKAVLGLKEPGAVSFLIWTTTPWTLPANLAIAVNREVEYSVVKYERVDEAQPRLVIVASDLVKQTFAAGGNKGDAPDALGDDEEWKGIKQFFNGTDSVQHEVVAIVTGEKLVGLTYTHPFVNDRVGTILAAEYVTTTDGTGLVHTAPGHGEEDYETGLAHGLDVYCPVQADGKYDSTTPAFLTGLSVWEANPIIVENLRDSGHLFAEQSLVHRYPHDWRSKTPTIFRATEQWFISLDRPYTVDSDAGGEKTLRNRAIEVANSAAFYPAWGRQRLLGMLENRPDWCISRQRAWGLPIPVFYNEVDEPLLTPESVRAVSRAFAEHGSDAWWNLSPAKLLKGCDTGESFPVDSLRKETDIFDVWFESGSSWHSVLDAREELGQPADLYLEGSDQHRGWFQLSLLASLGSQGKAPFKQVLTHGFIVKPDGTKVSKSDPEYVTAMQEVNRHGADLLRLWTCSVDYQGDVRASPEIIEKFGDEYRKIRNTVRFLLGNLFDFDPSKEMVEDVPAESLDGWMLHELDKLITEVTNAYDNYLMHHAYRAIRDFCTVQVSQVYGNAMKDRLYCDAADSPDRRRSQTVQYRVVDALIRLLAPMLVFTADEAWEHLPGASGSVHAAGLPELTVAMKNDGSDLLMKLREDALLQLDQLKKDAGLNKATDAEVVYALPPVDRAKLEPFGVDLADVVGAGSYSILPTEGRAEVKVFDRRENYALCARSRKRTPDVGDDEQYPDLSARDAAVMRSIG